MFQIPDGTSNVPVEQVLAVVAQDITRLRPVPPPLRSLPRLDVPQSPIRARYPEIPTPISATSFYQAPSPRLPETPINSTPALRRPSLHYHHPLSTASHLESSQSNASLLHSATHRSPSGFESPSLDALMHTNGGPASVRRMIIDHHQTSCGGTCGSESTVGCETSNLREAEVAGMNLRRSILASFSSKGPSGASEYFDGIL